MAHAALLKHAREADSTITNENVRYSFHVSSKIFFSDYVCSLRDDSGSFVDGIEDRPRYAIVVSGKLLRLLYTVTKKPILPFNTGSPGIMK